MAETTYAMPERMSRSSVLVRGAALLGSAGVAGALAAPATAAASRTATSRTCGCSSAPSC